MACMGKGFHARGYRLRFNAPELPEKARTWVNEFLQFTHGYGLVMNFVSKMAEEGLPQYIIEDIPPRLPLPSDGGPTGPLLR